MGHMGNQLDAGTPVRVRVTPYLVRYWLPLLVALAVVAVDHRRLAPSSSATTSTVDRRCHPQPSRALLELAHDHDPAALAQRLGGVLGLVAPDDHGEE
jgi:hypothetical protein